MDKVYVLSVEKGFDNNDAFNRVFDHSKEIRGVFLDRRHAVAHAKKVLLEQMEAENDIPGSKFLYSRKSVKETEQDGWFYCSVEKDPGGLEEARIACIVQELPVN